MTIVACCGCQAWRSFDCFELHSITVGPMLVTNLKRMSAKPHCYETDRQVTAMLRLRLGEA